MPCVPSPSYCPDSKGALSLLLVYSIGEGVPEVASWSNIVGMGQ